MAFADGVVNAMDRYKRGFYFSPDFVGNHSWNGFERNLLFQSIGNKQFCDVARATGCDEVRDSRAIAVADLNDDGRLDLIIQNNNAEPTVFVNTSKSQGLWVKFNLTGDRNRNRDAIGASIQLEIVEAGNIKRLVRWVEAGNGYASQSPRELHFGLGNCQKVVSLTVRWPDGSSNKLTENLDQIIGETVSIKKTGSQIAMEVRGSKIQVAKLDRQAGAK